MTHQRCLSFAPLLVLVVILAGGASPSGATSYGVGGNPEWLLPEPIDDRDLEHWSLLLTLSEAQRNALTVRHEDYVSAYHRGVVSWRPRLTDATSQLDLHDDGTWEYAQAYAALIEQRDAAVSELRRIDREFLEGMLPVLTDEQIGRFEFVRLDRDRTIHTTGIVNRPLLRPDARVDLVDLFRVALEEVQHHATNTGLIKLEEEYLRARVPVLKSMSVEWGRASIRAYRMQAELVEALASDGRMMDAESFLEMRTQVWRRQSLLAERLAAINRDFVARASEILASPGAQRFEDAFRVAAYPTIYGRSPDGELRRRLSRLQEGELIEPNQARRIEALMFLYDQRYAQECRSAESLVNDYFAAVHDVGGVTNAEAKRLYEDELAVKLNLIEQIVISTEQMILEELDDRQREAYFRSAASSGSE